APMRKIAAPRRYLVSARGVGEVCDVNLIPAGFVRVVGDPLAVGRECRVGIRKLRLDQSKVLAVSGKGKYPDRISRTRWASRISQIPAIPAHRPGYLTYARRLEN